MLRRAFGLQQRQPARGDGGHSVQLRQGSRRYRESEGEGGWPKSQSYGEWHVTAVGCGYRLVLHSDVSRVGSGSRFQRHQTVKIGIKRKVCGPLFPLV
jgi:hypothetical protein